MWPLSWRGSAALLLFTLTACARDEPAPLPHKLSTALTPSLAQAPAARSAQAPAQTPAALDATGDDDASLVLPDLMDLQVDPAAAVLLAAVDPQGAWQAHDASLPPQPSQPSQQAWQAVEEAAAQLQRSGQWLAKPAVAHGRADWLQWTASLRHAADTGTQAAQRHDRQRLALAATQLQGACQGCHARYAAHLVKGLTVSGLAPQEQR